MQKGDNLNMHSFSIIKVYLEKHTSLFSDLPQVSYVVVIVWTSKTSLYNLLCSNNLSYVNNRYCVAYSSLKMDIKDVFVCPSL